MRDELELTPLSDFDAPAIATDASKLKPLPSPHAHMFRLTLALLSIVGIVAIAVAVIAVSDHTSQSTGSGNWSAWSPTEQGSAGVQQIASFVAPFYRISDSQQLNVISPLSLTSETAAGTTTGKGLTIAINPNGSSSTSSLEVLNGETVAYNICGLGASDCELSGTASINRMLLLRREALELALYTLKYITSSQNVLVVLPPGHTVTTSGKETPVTVAVLFDRTELAPLLKHPLSESLQADPPEVSQLTSWSKSEEAGFVDEVTARGLFSSQVESEQEGGNLLVLSPLPSQ